MWGRTVNGLTLTFHLAGINNQNFLMRDEETGRPIGVTQIGDYTFETTGILGVTYDSGGQPRRGSFPVWATLGDDLALARDVVLGARTTG